MHLSPPFSNSPWLQVPGFVIVVHVLGDGHEHALVALNAVAGLYLGAGEYRDADGRRYGEDAERLLGEDSLQPFTEVLVQEAEKDDGGDELDGEQREGEVEV